MNRFLRIASALLGLATIGAGFYPLGIAAYLLMMTTDFSNETTLGEGGAEHLFFVNGKYVSKTMVCSALFCTGVTMIVLGSGLLLLSRRLKRKQRQLNRSE